MAFQKSEHSILYLHLRTGKQPTPHSYESDSMEQRKGMEVGSGRMLYRRASQVLPYVITVMR